MYRQELQFVVQQQTAMNRRKIYLEKTNYSFVGGKEFTSDVFTAQSEPTVVDTQCLSPSIGVIQ